MNKDTDFCPKLTSPKGIVSASFTFAGAASDTLESQTETRRQDKKMVERVSELDETIKSMSEELGRKVSVEEVADKLGITEAEIEDILKLAGEEVKDEES